VLLDVQRRLLDVKLLHDSGQLAVAAQVAAAVGAGVQRMDEESGHLLVREKGALVLGMSGLAAAAALVLAGRRWRRRRLDDVRRRRLGGGRGVLAGRRQLLLKPSHHGLQLLQLSALLIQLCLQTLAAGTGGYGHFAHALFLLPDRLIG